MKQSGAISVRNGGEITELTPGFSATILVTALQLGIAGDVLLRAPYLGLNVFLLVTAISICALQLANQRDEELPRQTVALLALAALFAGAFVWRDAEFLSLINLLVIAIALALPLLGSAVKSLASSEIVQYARALFLACENAATGAWTIAAGVNWQGMTTRERPAMRRVYAVGRGVAIALPLIVVFGALFMAADAVFARMVTTTLRFDLGSAVGHVVLTIFLAWITAGWLRGFLFSRAGSLPAEAQAPRGFLGTTELSVVLGLLNLLFLAFVLVQVRYLFGGAWTVAVTPGLTFAEYARKGFFELVTVSGLVLPVVLGADWIRARKGIASEWLFRSLSGMLIALLLVIMGSAVYRMRLYQAEFGLTDDRFYASAFMGWLAIVFVWFGATVLRGRRAQFTIGAFTTAVLAAAALNVANPDALIARTNLDRLAAGKRFDAVHLSYLSAESVPIVVAALSKMTPADRCVIARRMLRKFGPANPADWRGWNWSRWQARLAVESRVPELLKDAGYDNVADASPKANHAAKPVCAPAAEPTTAAPQPAAQQPVGR